MDLFETTVRKRIFGPMREKVTGGWQNLLSKESNNLYSSLNIVRVVKSRG